jgi:hypothetical protein
MLIHLRTQTTARWRPPPRTLRDIQLRAARGEGVGVCPEREVAALSKADSLLAKYKSQPKTKITAESLEKRAKSKGKKPALRVDVDADRQSGTTKGKGSSALGYTSLSDEEPVAASPVLGGAFATT